jgi:diguanylate cyclase (GGDEF)-like protein
MLRRWTLLRTVCVMTAGCFVAIGLALAGLLEHQVRDRLVDESQRRAVQVALEVGRGPIGRGPLGDRLDPAARRELDRLLARVQVGRWVHDVKLWNPERRVLYTQDREVLGTVRPISSALAGALRGETRTNFHRVEEAGGDGGLFEVYTPVRDVHGRQIGAFEVYLPYAPVARQIQRDTRDAVAVLAGGLGLLYLLLLPIVARASATLRRQADEQHRLAREDDLTGLPNRRWLLDRLRTLVVRDAPGPSAALLLVDLDRFKDVNDALGHHNGDELLRLASRRMRGALRDGDVLARLGGDEFAVLLGRLSGREDAAVVADRLGEALDDPFELDGVPVYVEASIGIAVWPEHGRTGDELLRHADVAMYEAKRRQSGWAVFEADAGDERDRLTRLGELRRALDRDELVLHFQPKVSVSTGELVGVEALVRWQHPERGLIPPNDFVPLAEQTGLIRPLTRRVLDRALEQCRAWQDAGLSLSVAVNVAPRLLSEPDFPTLVGGLLDRWGIPPAQLELEITESGLMVDAERTQEVLWRLHDLGVRLSIDDFGTGYSSLSRLRELPIDHLKIDRSFVQRLEEADADAAIVRSTIGLGQSLGLRVVAEGVETEDALRRLGSFGCDQAQGFHIARPLPAAELAAWAARPGAAVRS